MYCWIVGIPSTSVSKLNCHDSVLEGKKGDSFQNKNFFPWGLLDTQNRPGCTNRTKCYLSGHLVFIWGKKTTLPSSLHPSYFSQPQNCFAMQQKSSQETETLCCSLLTVCPVSSAWRVGGPGIHIYTRMIRSVPPVTKNLPPEEKESHLVPLLVQLEKQHPTVSSHMLTRTEGRTKRLVTHPVFLHEFDCSSTANRPIICTHPILYMDHMI